jgi:hypothetical protein
MPIETALDSFYPLKRRPAVRIEIRENVARRGTAASLASNDQPFRWLIDHTDTRDPGRYSAGVIRARVVDDNDFVWKSTLTEKGM